MNTVQVVYVRNLQEDYTGKKRYSLNTNNPVSVGDLVRQKVGNEYIGTTMRIVGISSQPLEEVDGISLKTMELAPALRTKKEWLEAASANYLKGARRNEWPEDQDKIGKSEFLEWLKTFWPTLETALPAVYTDKWY